MNSRMLLVLLTVFTFGCATTESQPVAQASQAVRAMTNDAAATTQAASHFTYKRKIAIAAFRNDSMYGQGLLAADKSVSIQGNGAVVLVGEKMDPYAKQAYDDLHTHLIKSGLFMVLEYKQPVDKNAVTAGDFKIEQSKDLMGVDAIVVGAITQLGRKTTGKEGFLSSTKKQAVECQVSVRLIDVKTGRAFYAETGAGEATTEAGEVMGFGSKASYDATLTDKAISIAVQNLVDSIVKSLQAREWKTYVLDIQGDQIFIGGGSSQGLKAGDKLAVFRQGKEVVNRQVGTTMNLPAQKIADIEVVSSFGTDETQEGSVCKLVSGKVPEEEIANIYVGLQQ